jgi:hypothetical protein
MAELQYEIEDLEVVPQADYKVENYLPTIFVREDKVVKLQTYSFARSQSLSLINNVSYSLAADKQSIIILGTTILVVDKVKMEGFERKWSFVLMTTADVPIMLGDIFDRSEAEMKVKPVLVDFI